MNNKGEGAQVTKWLKVIGIAAVLCALAVSAGADSNTYNYQGTGPYFNTKNGAIVDASGNAKVVDADRDRDLSAVIGVMTANALAAGTTRGGVSAQAVSSFSRLGLMLRWTFAAAADSDSVNIVVKIYAKKSTSIDDGMNHLWTLRGSGIAADSSMMSSVAADSSVLFRAPATYYVTRNRNPKLTVTGAAFGRSVVVPLRMWRQAGNGGIYIPLEDNGVPFNAQYFGIEVSNVNTTTALFTFTAELWPKVN